MSVPTRKARPADVPALVDLRLANAEHHARLAPALHRLPDRAAVRDHFEGRLRDGPDDLLIVAEIGGEVAGMAEVLVRPAPPDHQILIPLRTAEVHTVVLDRHRGRGVGSSLLAAAERAARDHAVDLLLAVILATNGEAVAFYRTAGFGQHGLLLSKRLD
jgi:ribosomal protein S18 acetylase RimI-like enzyme